MEEIGVGDSTWLCACPQGHTSPTFLSEETAFEKFLLLVCNRWTTHPIYQQLLEGGYDPLVYQLLLKGCYDTLFTSYH